MIARISSILAYLLLLSFFSSSNLIAHEKKSTYKYNEDFEIKQLLLTLSLYLPKFDSFPLLLQVINKKTHEPYSGALCLLETNSTTKEAFSDNNGEVFFWVPEPNLFSKLKCRIRSELPIEINFSMTATGFGAALFSEGGFETGYGWPEFNDAGVRILYNKGYEKEAKDLMALLKEEKALIENLSKMGLKPLKIIFTDNSDVICIGGWGVSPNTSDIDKFKTLPHEWVEGSLSKTYGVYEDTKNRWIGDGLAQYYMFEIDEKYYPEGLYELCPDDKVFEDSSNVFDLSRWRAGNFRSPHGGDPEWLNYMIAPYFWAKVVDKSGNPEIIAQFLDEFKKQKKRTSKKAIEVLSNLSGLDINKELVISSNEYRENIYKYWPIPFSPPGMLLITATNTFLMGDSSDRFTMPVRNITLNDFFLDRYEVTNNQYCEFLNAMGNQKEGDSYWLDESSYPDILKEDMKYIVRKGRENYPVTEVSWFGAAAYAKWAGKRLPTEAEWEYAASNKGFTLYPWGNEWHDDYCNWADTGKLDGYEFTAPVGSFENGKNHYDCYDMAGNVFEWVQDWYEPYNPADTIDPQGPADGGKRQLKVHRGGCYKYPKVWQNRYDRIGGPPSANYPCVGFRCAADAPKIKEN